MPRVKSLLQGCGSSCHQAEEFSGSVTEGKGWELIAIVAVVVGGTLLTEGVGSIFGTLVRTLLLGMIQR